MSQSRRIVVLAALLPLFLFACESAPEPGSEAPAEPMASSEELPAGHPPVMPDADSVIAAPPPGSGTGDSGLRWTEPEGWLAETPSSAMRRAQYRVPGAAGDGELVVYYFGPGQGGGVMDNAERWAGQFAQPDGSDPRQAMRTERIDVGGVPVTLVEVTGTYSGGMTMMGGSPANLEDHMLLGAIAEGPDANWFFKLTGPRVTLESNKETFHGMIRSLTTGG